MAKITLQKYAIHIMNRIYCDCGVYKIGFHPPPEFIEFNDYKIQRGKEIMSARPIQIPMKCLHYTPNTNMNLTCKNEKRCIIYYEAICKEYFEKPKVLYWRCKNCGQVLTNEQYEYINLTVCPKCKEDKVFPVIEKKGK